MNSVVAKFLHRFSWFSANPRPSLYKAMGIFPLQLVVRNFYIICLYTYPFIAVYTPRHLPLLFDSDICGLPFNSHSPLHPFPLPCPAVASHFTLISTSSPSHCIFQPHRPLSQSCQGSPLWLHSFPHCQHAHFLSFKL